MLLIGPSGTGKTYLLNSLFEALGLEHRHYNASLISFDDLVGFPYPEADGDGVRFSRDACNGMGAESVLIDEISCCKPEHQNLSSRSSTSGVQGIAIEAALALGGDESLLGGQSGAQDYVGSAA